MIYFTLSVAGAILLFRFWTRLDGLEATVDELNGRLRRLEQRPATLTPLQAPVPVSVTPARAPSTPPIVGRPQSRPVPAVPPPVEVPAPPHAAAVHSASPSSKRTEVLPIAAVDERDALETRIGSRWLLYVGVVAIIVGVSYFEKLAIDSHWIGETARVLQGAVVGAVLIGVGLRFVRAGYRLYGQVLCGCGVAVLYVSTYAAFTLYHLISQPAAFVVMSAVTVLAAWLADRQQSQGLALVAVGGGFATPFLIPQPTVSEVSLFGYETILVAGTMLLARRRDWPVLNLVSYASTVLTISAWASAFYVDSAFLTTELFLTVFCAMFLFVLHDSTDSMRSWAWAARTILWTGPPLYYLASLTILWTHAPSLLIYLVALSLAGAVIGRRNGSGVQLAFWAAVAVPLLAWSDANGGTSLTIGVAAWSAVYVMNLAALLDATLGGERDLGALDVALLHVNGLASYAGAYLLLDPHHGAVTAPLAAGFALFHVALGFLTMRRRREEALHFFALAFTLLTIAIALRFEGAAVTTGWAAEGAVIVWLGLRERRDWLRLAGLTLFMVAIGRLLALQFSDPPIGQSLVLNQRAACGAFVITLVLLLTKVRQTAGGADGRTAEIGAGLTGAALLLLSLCSSEIIAYWTLHSPPPFEPVSQLIAAGLIVGTLTIWIGLTRQQHWIRSIGAIVTTVAVFALLSAQVEAVPRGYVALLNARAGAGLFAVVTLYILAALHRRFGADLEELPATLAVLLTSASLLTLSLLTSEIDAFWAVRGAGGEGVIARGALLALAWAAVGGFLIWRGLLARRTWVRAIGGGLLAIAVTRLLIVQFAVVPAGFVVIANARVVASVFVVAMLYGLARLYEAAPEKVDGRYSPQTVFWLLGNLLTLTLFSGEIIGYWQIRDPEHLSQLASANSHFAREMMLSITWALYATLLIVIGLKKQYAPIRYFAMTVFVVTIVKVFAVDLAELDRIYRVLSVIGLGVTLLVTSYLYQRSRP